MPALGLGLGLPYSPYKQTGGGNGGDGGGNSGNGDGSALQDANIDFNINVAGDYFTAPATTDDSLNFDL